MSQPKPDPERVASLQAAIQAQAEIVRILKNDNATKEKLRPPVEALKKLKGELEALIGSTREQIVDRGALEELLKRRFFFISSFAIYGGVKGLYDFGPPGCALKTNFLQAWRQHFVLEENMLEIDCPCLTPHAVLDASGHVDKFTDLMVKEIRSDDKGAPEFFRADHLLKEKLEFVANDNNSTFEEKEEAERILGQVDNLNADELHAELTKYKVLSPNGFPITNPVPFNLMFPTQIGPTGLNPGFLRPETAQGIFVNFRKLLDYNGGKMPFAGAQIGQAFRNEISPRAGLLRVREFTLAEIEHFVNPDDKKHPKFERIRNQVMNLFPQQRQLMVQGPAAITIGEAVDAGMVNNQTLGFFMARTHQFLVKCGIKSKHLRFRQHLEHEMAHYASDCWDAEIETSYGWVEVVGHADRACFDLTQHASKTNTNMEARVDFDEPQLVVEHTLVFNKGLMGKTFKTQNKDIVENLSTFNETQRVELKSKLEKDGKVEITICTGEKVVLTKEMLNIERTEKRVQSKSFTPSVIEPSFGVGRILYSILEHSYYVREGDDEQRAVLKFAPHLAPVKCSVLPLMIKPELMPDTERVADLLRAAGVSVKVDTAGAAIGRRYARTDEIGVPFGVTVDMATVESKSPLFGTVTLRERDSMKQVRIKTTEIGDIVARLCDDRITWAEVQAKFPAHE